MTDDRKYVRVYYNDLIRDYPDVWADDAALATWLRMLATADPMWPTPPELPRSVRPRPMASLTSSSLVETLPSGRYRMKGLDAERGKRQQSARNAAALRWHSEGIAPAYPVAMPKRAEQSKDEQSIMRALPSDDGRADLEAFVLLTRRAPTSRQRKLLDGLLDRHDLTGPAWAADIMMRHPDDPIGAVIEADKAWRADRIAEAQAAEAPKPVPRRSRGLPESTRHIMAEMQKLEAEGHA